MVHSIPPPGSPVPNPGRGLEAWQSKVLPLMVGLLVFLTVFFIVATVVQAFRIQRQIEGVAEASPIVAELSQPGGENSLAMERVRWGERVRLEQFAIHSRYRQASLILMSRVWIIYLGFVTGMILALVGAAFVLGKLREPVSEVGAESSFLKVSIASASPGLVLAVLGTALMTTTMIIRSEVSVTDTPLYVTPTGQVTEAGVQGDSAPPPAHVPDYSESNDSQPPDDSELDVIDEEEERRSRGAE